MRLVSYSAPEGLRSGVLVGDRVVETASAARQAGLGEEPWIDWASNRQVIQADPEALARLDEAARTLAAGAASQSAVRPLADVHLGPPIPDPGKIICLGLNYRSHAEEAGFTPPQVPILFAKFSNALNGPYDPILLPEVSREVDYEAELALVIGKICKHVDSASAYEYIAGYMALNDVSARDLQMRVSQWLSGKTLDTFAPCGPALVVGEIDDPQNLAITTRLNGEPLQQGDTRNMIFPIPEILAYVSSLMTLQPGDIIATGTPEGVGFMRQPPIFLQPGDVVEVEIEAIGALRNPVHAPLERP